MGQKKQKFLAIMLILFTILGCTSGGSANASTTNKLTETNDVAINKGVPLANTAKYKKVNYSFLEKYAFGKTNKDKAIITFNSVQLMKESTLENLKEGAIIRTQGYYKAGDGGAATYEIVKNGQYEMEELSNGLYAKIVPDTFTDSAGTNWFVFSVKQFGAKGNGKNEDNYGIQKAVSYANNITKSTQDIARSIVYIPKGQYKCTNQLNFNGENLNIVGYGEGSVLFTDNDYRKNEGYAEHFIQVWGAKSVYFSDFKIEAREVDLYNYMRQFSLIYASDVYVYDVDFIVPQEAYNCYYFQDKQYSNVCCYTGNRNITIDGCKMVQMSGTYRGANLGIMDIWSAKEENITIMNCDMYGNARDEQIGIFSTSKESAGINNVEFINNTIHAYEPKYTNIVGNATMRFTVGYYDSQNISNIHMAGNHFIVECDSKFMTFGAVKNCVIENNIIEIPCTFRTWSIVFDSCNTDADNILVKNNEFYLTTNENCGKMSFINGKLTFEHNRVFSDTYLYGFSGKGPKVNYNEFVLLKEIGCITADTSAKGNVSYLHGGVNSFSSFSNQAPDDVIEFSDNVMYNYKRNTGKRGVWEALFGLTGKAKSITIENNKYYAPNTRYTGADNINANDYDKDGNVKINNRIFYYRSGYGEIVKDVVLRNNTFQGATGIINYGSLADLNLVDGNNKFIPFEEDLTEESVTKIDILNNSKKVTEITTTEDTVNLKAKVWVGDKKVYNKKIKWYSTVNGIATVSDKGVVKRGLYGTATIYAVSLDGSEVFGKCVIHFEKNKATDINLKKDTINLEPGLKEYIEYTVLPKGANQDLIYKSANSKIATVSKTGLVEGIKTGETDIICYIPGNTSINKKIHIVVKDLTVKKMGMDSSWMYFKNSEIGTVKQLSVNSYYPNEAVNCEVGKWKSMNTSIARVSNTGKFRVVGNGITDIRAYSTDGKCYATCTVYVQPPKVKNLKVENITENGLKLTWDAVENCYGYYIYKWNSTTKAWELCNEKYITDTSYDIKGLRMNKSYKYCVRAFISRWDNSGRTVYESEDSIINVKTTNYKAKALSISCSKIELKQGFDPSKFNQVTAIISYNDNDVSFDKIQLEYGFDNPDMAEIVKEEKDGNKIKLYIKGLKPGITKFWVKSKNGYTNEIKIPVGIIENTTVKSDSVKIETEYQKVHFQFDGIEDESNIDGYIIRKRIGYRSIDVAFIKKTGEGVYKYTLTDDLEDGKTYIYDISVCMKDGDDIYYGWCFTTYQATLPERVLATKVSLGTEPYVITQGEVKDIRALVSPKLASISKLDWYSSNTDVVSVRRIEKVNKAIGFDYAQIVGVSVGVTNINVITTDSSMKTVSQKVVVVPKKIEKVETKTDASRVLLKWDTIKNVTGYYIYRYNNTSKKWEKVASTSKNTYLDSNLTGNTTYKYKVVPYILDGKTQYKGKATDTITVKIK